MKYIVLVLGLLFFTGCGASLVTIPIDGTPIGGNNATLIIYQGNPEFAFETKNKYPIYVDEKLKGYVSSEVPLKIAVSKGMHTLHTEHPIYVDTVTNIKTYPNKVYYMRLWVDNGLIFSYTRIDQTAKRDSYKTMSYNRM